MKQWRFWCSCLWTTNFFTASERDSFMAIIIPLGAEADEDAVEVTDTLTDPGCD